MISLRRFVQVDLWRIRLAALPPARALPLKYVRIFLAAFRRFGQHGCQLRASALTFFSLLSVVPVAAMAFGIAKGFSFEKLLQEKLLEQLPGQEEVLLQVFGFANSMLENTKGGLIAGVGVVVLFWTVIKVLGNIEESFNHIWGVERPRTLARKATDYLSIMLIGPVLLVLASSATVFVTTQVEFIAAKLAILGPLRSTITLALRVAPYMIMGVLFSFVYASMPNTRTRLSSCVFAGVIAGFAYQVVQWFYVAFQVGVAKQNAIYGSFAALPLFLAWLQISWLIVLAGAEIANAHQNVDMLEFEPEALRSSVAFRRLLALWVAGLVCRNFLKGAEPLTVQGLGEATEIPRPLLSRILADLTNGGVVAVGLGRDARTPGYLPATDPGRLTVAHVTEALERLGTEDIPVARTPELEALSATLKTLAEQVGGSSANRPLAEI
jgi:membrane protein